MCFGGSPNKSQATPAPAPAPPEPIAQEGEIGAPRVEEDMKLFGSSTPSTRVDRSLSPGAGGTGIKM